MFFTTIVLSIVVFTFAICSIKCNKDEITMYQICTQRRLEDQNVANEFPVSLQTDCARKCTNDKQCLSTNTIRSNFGYICQILYQMPGDCSSLAKDPAADVLKLRNPRCQHGGIWNSNKQNCGTCDQGFAGDLCERHIIDCQEGKLNGQTSAGWIKLLIQPIGSPVPFPANCFLTYGITLLGARSPCDSYGSFNRRWSDFKEGFGTIGCTFFIGLQKLHLLTAQRDAKLKVALRDARGHSAYYNNFRIDGEANKYTLHYGSYHSHSADRAGDGFGMGAPTASINHMPFCTPDRNCYGCASVSGWWFNTNCAAINLHVPCTGTELKWPRDSNDNSTFTAASFSYMLESMAP